MKLDPQTMSPSALYHTMVSVIVPRPIAWVSTKSAQGQLNLAPYSFFTGVTANPPSVVFSPVNKNDGSKKDTVQNIEANGQFVINVVPHRLAEQMNLTSADFEYGVSEFEKAGLTEKPSEKVEPPGVLESPIQVECELMQIVPVGEGPGAANLVIGRILMLHVADDVLVEGRIDANKLDAIGRMGGANYARTTETFTVERPAAQK